MLQQYITDKVLIGRLYGWCPYLTHLV